MFKKYEKIGDNSLELHDCEATFHSWGCNFEEFEGGPGNFSTAIVERDDGTVENVPVENIRFIDKPMGD
jgi:hypothetical protein